VVFQLALVPVVFQLATCNLRWVVKDVCGANTCLSLATNPRFVAVDNTPVLPRCARDAGRALDLLQQIRCSIEKQRQLFVCYIAIH